MSQQNSCFEEKFWNSGMEIEEILVQGCPKFSLCVRTSSPFSWFWPRVKAYWVSSDSASELFEVNSGFTVFSWNCADQVYSLFMKLCWPESFFLESHASTVHSDMLPNAMPDVNTSRYSSAAPKVTLANKNDGEFVELNHMNVSGIEHYHCVKREGLGGVGGSNLEIFDFFKPSAKPRLFHRCKPKPKYRCNWWHGLLRGQWMSFKFFEGWTAEFVGSDKGYDFTLFRFWGQPHV